MWQTACWLAFWLLVTVAFTTFSLRVTPPGNVWRPTDFFAMVALVSGAYFSAGVYRHRIVCFLYGALGASAILPVLLPEGRDYFSIAMGRESIWSYIAQACGFTVAMGVACCVAAAVRHARLDAASHTREPRCTNCGYLLCGLPQKRCPECGTTFANDIPAPPIEHDG